MKGTPLYTFARRLLPWFFRLLMPVRIENAQYIPASGKLVLCCNHASMTDPIRLAFTTRRQVFFMAKEELFKNAFVASVISGLGAFPVSRGKGDQGAIGTAQEILGGDGILGIFIEGTRSKDGNLLRPKSGAVRIAASCGAPIVPCCITPEKGKLPRLFRTCRVTFGRPISPEELNVTEGSSLEYRNASRMVMDRIRELRENDLRLLGAGKNAQ
jgi:1-acyl-sn-glycerol-3-phosphate acyltransferase